MMKRRSGERSPRECRPLTNVPSGPSCFSAAAPMRVMIRMLATTYGLSVISTPTLESGEPSGPMTYGMTYMVRPRIAPSNSAPTFRFASAGAILLRRADEGQVLGAGDVGGIRAVQEAVGVMVPVQAEERALDEHLLEQE